MRRDDVIPEGRIVDVGAGIPDIRGYWFLGVAGAVTMQGIWVDMQGYKCQGSKAFELTIPVAGGGNDPVTAQTAVGGGQAPDDAVGIEVRTTGDLYYSKEHDFGTIPADLKANYAKHPRIVMGDSVAIGRVSV